MGWRLIALGAATVAGTAVLALAPGTVAAALEVLRSLGPWAGPACAAVVVAASLACIPRWLYTAATGFACGALVGIPVALASAVAGASLAFAVGRRMGRGWVERRARESVRTAAIDEAVAAGGFAMVALVRVSPVLPCSVMSYVFGASRIPFSTFLAATALGMIPGTVIYAALGAAARDLAAMLARGAWTPWTVGYVTVGGAVTVGALIWMFAATRRRIRERLPAG